MPTQNVLKTVPHHASIYSGTTWDYTSKLPSQRLGNPITEACRRAKKPKAREGRGTAQRTAAQRRGDHHGGRAQRSRSTEGGCEEGRGVCSGNLLSTAGLKWVGRTGAACLICRGANVPSLADNASAVLSVCEME